MPFTLAHTAIVLPFYRKRWFSATALIVGSVAPDFEYFFKMGSNSEYSHTIAGIFYFNIPVVILLSFVFHLYVKRNLLHNSPRWVQRKFQDLLHFDLTSYFRKHWVVFLISAMIGSASHVFWDSFTHGSGYFANTLWFYQGTYVPFDGVNYPLFYALQQISTAAGLFVLFLFVFFKKSDPGAIVYQPRAKYWLTFFAIMVVAMGLRFIPFPEDVEIGNIVVSIISSTCLAAILCGLIRLDSKVAEVA